MSGSYCKIMGVQSRGKYSTAGQLDFSTSSTGIVECEYHRHRRPVRYLVPCCTLAVAVRGDTHHGLPFQSRVTSMISSHQYIEIIEYSTGTVPYQLQYCMRSLVLV